MAIPFWKIHGLGNDFLVVESSAAAREEEDLARLARAICDRHEGVGADGLVLVRPLEKGGPADFDFRILNADGGEAEMSGNGLRCAAAWSFLRGGSRDDLLRFSTLAGLRIARLVDHDGFEYRFELDMGEPILDSERIPILLSEARNPVMDEPLVLGGRTIRVTALSMGNPHCVLFGTPWEAAEVRELGNALSCHPAFPRQTNVEFVEVLSRSAIRVSFWERGVGATQSSGTGSCAAAVASMLHGHTGTRVEVLSARGRSVVDWRDRRTVYLTAPAVVVCRGEFSEPSSKPDRTHPPS